MKDGKIHFINTSDIHLKGKNAKALYRELKEGLYKDVEAKKETLDLVGIWGDFFDRKLSLNEEAGKLAIKFMNELLALCHENDIKVRIIRGTKTHDYNQLETFRYLEQKYDFRIINTVCTEEIFPNFVVLYLPEEYMEDPDEYYKEFFEVEGKYDFIFFHGTFDFAGFNGSNQDVERHISSAPTFKYKIMSELVYGMVIGGHIHKFQVYKDKIVYCGPYTRNSFAEEDQPGYFEVLYDLETLEVEHNFIPNKLAPVFKTFELSQIFTDQMDIQDKLEVIKNLSETYDQVRFNFDRSNFQNDGEIEIIREALMGDQNIKVQYDDNKLTGSEDSIEEEKESKYSFIVERRYDIFETVSRFIDLEFGTKIPVDTVKDILLIKDTGKKK